MKLIKFDQDEYRSRLAELDVIGCVLNNPDILDEYPLEKDDFTNLVIRAILIGVQYIHDNGGHFIDTCILGSILEKYYPTYHRIYNKSHGDAFFMQAVTKYHPQNLDAYYSELKKYSLLRKLLIQGIDVSDIYDPDDSLDDDKKSKAEQFMKMTPDEIYSHYQRKLENIEFSGQRNLNTFDVLNEDIQEEKYIIDGIIMEGTINAIVAGSKVGKSYLLEEMLFCIENGLEWQGIKTEQSHCLLVDYELTKAKLQKRCKMLIDKYHSIYPDKEFKMFDVSAEIECWNKQSIDDLLRNIRSYQKKYPDTKVIALDPFYRFFDGDDENNNNQVADCIGKIAKYKQYGLTFLYAHHTSKYGTKEKDPFLASSGAYAHSKIVDQAIGLMPKDTNDFSKGIILTNKGREDNGTYSLSRDEWGFFTRDEQVEERKIPPLDANTAAMIKRYLNGKKQGKRKATMKSVFNSVPEAKRLDYRSCDSYGLILVKKSGQGFDNWTIKVKDNFSNQSEAKTDIV